MLPVPLTSFIGRTREIADLKAFVTRTRLLTLVGAGGSGKSRLAIALAHALQETFDEFWYVELAPLTDPTLVVQAVADAIGVRASPEGSLGEALLQHLRARYALLILDNCEHVIAACAQLVYPLLVGCPRLTIVTTSREPLKVEGEQTYLIPLLSMPHAGVTLSPRDLEQYEAIRLFIERARAVNANFELTAQNADAITRLCRRLDGIPLAIELAAARTKILSPEQIAARLDDRFLLLKADSRTILPRHQTLRAALDWSYELLDAEERALFNRLAVFAGSFDLEAVESIEASGRQTQSPDLSPAPAPAPTLLLDTLTRLVEKSLIVVEQRGGKSARYRLLETIREYALEKLRGSGAEERTRTAHAQFYAQKVRQADLEFFGPRQIALLEWMDDERDNARSALEWLTTRARAGDADAVFTGMQTAAGLWWYWDLRGYVGEGRMRLEPFLLLAENFPPSPARAYGQLILGHVALLQGDRELALAAPQRALTMGEALGDEQVIMFATQRIAIQRARMPNPIEALPSIEQALALGRRFQNRHIMYTMLLDIAEIAHMQGDEARTEEAFREALELIRAQEDEWNLAAIHYSIGVHAWNHGDDRAALNSFRESLKVKQKMNDLRGMAYSFDSLAWVAARQGEPARAALLFGATDALFERMGARLFPRRQPLHDRAVELARAALGDAAFHHEFDRGRRVPLEDAIQAALAVGTGDDAPAQSSFSPPTLTFALVEPLSDRELQVLRLLATNLSNREIAGELVVSLNTIKTQLKSIYSKLDVHGRDEAVARGRALKLI